MIGVNAGAIILIICAFVASVAAVALCVLGAVVLAFSSKRRYAFIPVSIALVLVLMWAGLYFWIRPSPPKDYPISLQVPSNRAFVGFPGGQIKSFGDTVNHQIWGNLLINITLPDGRVIQGVSSRISVNVGPDGISSMSLSYRPSNSIDPFSYWKEGGGWNKRHTSKNNVLVDRGDYSAELFSLENNMCDLTLRWPPDPLLKDKAEEVEKQ